MATITHAIGGEPVEPSSGEWLDIHEPATGKVVAKVARGNAKDAEAAVAAAQQTFPAWSATPAAERSRILLKIADGIAKEREELARLESVDTGKPVALARAVDIPRSEANFRFFATAILHEHSELHATDLEVLNYTLRRPAGIALCISPWNLPLYLLTWKVAPALAAGCTVVAKPSEITPTTAYHLARIADEAGLPNGVLNVVHGLGAEVGPTLSAHPDVKTISFTGSTATGAAIAATAAPRFKRLALEMGGKNANLVFADADLDAAVSGSIRAAFTNQGQVCHCGSRILIERKAYDAFVERFVAAAKNLRVGDPNDEKTEQGAVVSKQHYEKVLGYLKLAKDEGAQVLAGGGPAPAPNDRCKDGWFIQPTVLAGLRPDSRTNQDEIFGPVVTVAPFDDEQEALAVANGTPYGLSAVIWTRDLARAHRVADRLETGVVWVNTWMHRDLRVPFGGIKASGVGREGGAEALHFFTEPKTVAIPVPGK
ncbi:MAG TPA: aldehyde dehydrogenase [Candidatus Polarisedimenticolaceae bacterium]|nr:aldehyde dehydrogenase [Candidatus Polarisedimenticolaceae bacterium]